MMARGRTWPAEWREHEDAVTSVRVRQLTDYRGHSHHLYFTNPGWYDGGRRLLFGSDRENRTNLFGLDLETGAIEQLTDLEPVPPPHETQFLSVCVNPRREVAYFWYRRSLVALDLRTREAMPLWEAPEGFRRSMINCTADGRYVCAGLTEDLSDRFRIDYRRGYVGFRETWEARPLCRILRVAADGGEADCVWEEKAWIGHINTSPTRANLLTFCHEGPWDRVDNRIWGLDLETGRTWRIRPREAEESPGHEYWLADGEHIGYHGRYPDGGQFFGRIHYDNSDRIEFRTPHATGHMHSNDFRLIAGDGGREGGVVRLWRQEEGRIEGPRVLCEHRSSFHIQQTHVHPRFSPDGTQVLFTSDRSGYGNLYLVEVPAFESLPALPAGAR